MWERGGGGKGKENTSNLPPEKDEPLWLCRRSGKRGGETWSEVLTLPEGQGEERGRGGCFFSHFRKKRRGIKRKKRLRGGGEKGPQSALYRERERGGSGVRLGKQCPKGRFLIMFWEGGGEEGKGKELEKKMFLIKGKEGGSMFFKREGGNNQPILSL